MATCLSEIKQLSARCALAFAADCAERVLPLWEAVYPDDDRPRRAIEAARDYGRGKVGKDELCEARDMAMDAAMDACADSIGPDAWNRARAAAYWAAWAAGYAADAIDERYRFVAVTEAASRAARATREAGAKRNTERTWQARELACHLGHGRGGTSCE